MSSFLLTPKELRNIIALGVKVHDEITIEMDTRSTQDILDEVIEDLS